MPGVAVKIPHARRCLRANPSGETIRISFVDHITAITRFDVILVHRPVTDIGYETLPDACRTRAHHGGGWFPIVEVSDHRRKFRIRSPQGKVHAMRAIPLGEVGAELIVGAIESAFSKQVEVEFA